MTRFKLSLGRMQCPRCQEASLEIMATGRLYKNGTAGKVIVTVDHDLDRYEIRRAPTDEELKKFTELAIAWEKKTEARNAPPVERPQFVPRDPSQPRERDDE